MKDELVDDLNNQIRNEFVAAYNYLAYANYFDEKSLSGYAHYYKVEALQKIDQAMKIYDYLQRNSKKVKLSDIVIDYEEYESIDEVLAKALQFEKNQTQIINDLFKKCVEEEDYRTTEFLKWFVVYQSKEESDARKMIQDRNNFNSLYMLDKEYRKRGYTKKL